MSAETVSYIAETITFIILLWGYGWFQVWLYKKALRRGLVKHKLARWEINPFSGERRFRIATSDSNHILTLEDITEREKGPERIR